MVLKNSKGQMAIFFVFIFQILFILFAMTLNVALVVHDKINLQNSLDLATLYGAKKQAEVLNAIAHINYQMRQNYKLLAWRYRILGGMAQKYEGHSPDPNAWCPGSAGVSIECKAEPPDNCSDSIYGNYCDIAFSVCINAAIWNRGVGQNGHSSDSYCKNNEVSIPRIPTYPPTASFLPWNASAAAQTEAAARAIEGICNSESGLSWLMTNLILSHFRLDQKDRKIMIETLYNKTLKVGKDLDGYSISKGAEKVFRKNLNYTNKKNYNPPTFYNSLKERDFSEFLEPLHIFPILQFMKFEASCGGKIQNLIDGGIDSRDAFSSNTTIQSFVNAHKNLFYFNTGPAPEPDLGKLSLGYKKKDNLILYYGMKASFSYRGVPPLFTPLENTKLPPLRASSFAKPFGGRIGPGKDEDLLLKHQIDLGTATDANRTQLQIYNLQPNYSRYPGDEWGLIDKTLHKDGTHKAFLIKTALLRHNGDIHQITDAVASIRTPFDISFFDHLNTGKAPDPLAVADGNDPAFGLVRLMELMAVFPDVFDITHYSISNNYMEVYFPKICKLIGENKKICDPLIREKIARSGEYPGYIRGDFGYPYSKDYLELNLATTKIANSFVPFFYAKNSNPVDINRSPLTMAYSNKNIRYPYLVKDPSHFLTSWAPTTQLDRYESYSFPERMFAKCYSHTSHSSRRQLKPIPSGCERGGRSGYSIKTISCDLVSTLDPQPDNLSEYCP